MEDKFIAYERDNSPLPSDKKFQIANANTKPWIKLKILKAFLDIAILKEMNQRNAVSVPSMIDFFVKKYIVYVSPGTIYPVFERLKGQGYIVKIPNRLTGLYSITNEGSNLLENVQQSLDELHYFLNTLVKQETDKIETHASVGNQFHDRHDQAVFSRVLEE